MKVYEVYILLFYVSYLFKVKCIKLCLTVQVRQLNMLNINIISIFS